MRMFLILSALFAAISPAFAQVNVGDGNTATTMLMPGAGISMTKNGSVVTIATDSHISDPINTISGATGSLKWLMPIQGNTFKRVFIQVNGYTSVAPQTITFPTPFAATPYVSSGSSLITLTSLSTTGVTIPIAVGAINGNIIIEGF